MKRPQRFGLADVTISKQDIRYQGFYQMHSLQVEHAAYRGGTVRIERELMVRPDAVVVLLYDPRAEEVVLIEQYRVGAHKAPTPWLLECVAGLIDPGESPEDVARRESEEEAGLTPGRLEFITEYFPSPGGTDEKITLYVGEVDASNAGGVYGLDHEGEDILVLRVTVATALEWLQAGYVNNAASIIALQWLALHGADLKQRWTEQ